MEDSEHVRRGISIFRIHTATQIHFVNVTPVSCNVSQTTETPGRADDPEYVYDLVHSSEMFDMVVQRLEYNPYFQPYSSMGEQTAYNR